MTITPFYVLHKELQCIRNTININLMLNFGRTRQIYMHKLPQLRDINRSYIFFILTKKQVYIGYTNDLKLPFLVSLTASCVQDK